MKKEEILRRFMGLGHPFLPISLTIHTKYSQRYVFLTIYYHYIIYR